MGTIFSGSTGNREKITKISKTQKLIFLKYFPSKTCYTKIKLLQIFSLKTVIQQEKIMNLKLQESKLIAETAKEKT